MDEERREEEPSRFRTRRRLLIGGAGVLGLGAVGAWRLLDPGPGPWSHEVQEGATLAPGGSVVFSIGGDDALLRRDADGRLVAIDLTCTHRRCTVRWNAGREEFACPCHKGIYDRDGRVLGGPPKRPLAQLVVKESGGRVTVVKQSRVEEEPSDE